MIKRRWHTFHTPLRPHDSSSNRQPRAREWWDENQPHCDEKSQSMIRVKLDPSQMQVQTLIEAGKLWDVIGKGVARHESPRKNSTAAERVGFFVLWAQARSPARFAPKNLISGNALIRFCSFRRVCLSNQFRSDFSSVEAAPQSSTSSLPPLP